MAVKLGKKQKGKAQVAEQKSAKKVKPVKKQESSEEDSSSEEEMEVQQAVAPVKKTTAKKTPAKKTPAKEAPAKKADKKTPAKEAAAKKKKAPPPAEEDSDDDSDEDDSDEEEEEEAPPVKKTKAGAKVVMTKQPEPEEDDEDEEDSDEEDEDDSDEEEEAAPKKAPKPAQTKQAEIDDDDDDDEDDSEDDDEDDEDEDSEEEEEPTKVQQVKDAKKGAKAQAEEEDDEDDEDDSDEDSDDDDDEDEEEEAPPLKKKKMAGGDAKTTKTDDSQVEGEIISIFIGGVPKGTPDEAVEEFFTSQGVQVMNARVIPNKSFAYVDVTSEKTFKKAMELNHQELNGVEIRLERGKSRNENSKQNIASTSSGGRDGSNATTLFVKGLNFDTTNNTLKEKFKCKEVRIPLKNGRPSGYAYMDFDTKEEVDNAMQTMQGAEIDGWNVILDYVGDKRKSGAQGSEESQTLHIKGLTDDVTEEDLKEKLGALEVRRPTRRDDPGSKVDFAYADFASLDEAKQAHAQFQGASVKDAILTLDYARSKRQSFGGRSEGEVDKKTLYIRGLSWETTQDRLQATLGADSVRIPYDKMTNQPKGFAYAEYSSESEAGAALEKFNGTSLDSYTLTMDYAKPRSSFGSPRGGRGNFGGGFRGGRGGRGGGGFGGGRGGGGRGGRGGGFRGGRGGRGGGFRGGRGGQGGGFGEYKGKKTSFDDWAPILHCIKQNSVRVKE